MTDTLPALQPGAPKSDDALTAKDFKSDQEVRWCPGCGDYAILAAVQGFLPELGIAAREHRLRLRHRLLVPLPVLHEHLRHALDPRPRAGHRHRARRVASRPVGLGRHRRRRRASASAATTSSTRCAATSTSRSCCSTTGSTASPRASTRPRPSRARSPSPRPQGSLDYAFNPVSLALGAEATFVARTIDSDRKHLTDVLRAAAAHEGTALVEIYQNCNIFNDGAWEPPQGRRRPRRQPHPPGRRRADPIRQGQREGRHPHLATATSPSCRSRRSARTRSSVTTPRQGPGPGLRPVTPGESAHRSPTARSGSSATSSGPSYDRLVRNQVQREITAHGPGDLQSLLTGSDTWTVS